MRMPCIAAAVGPCLVLACSPAHPQAKPAPPASPNARLLKAILRQDADAVRALIDAGADVNACETTVQNRTALGIAAELGNVPIVRLLLDHGAKANGMGPVPPAPLMCALAAVEDKKTPAALDMVRLLLERGADPNATGAEMTAGELALHLGPDVLALLFKHGLKRTATTISGLSLIEAAALSGQLNEMKVILDAGADPNVLDRDGSSLCATVLSEEVRKILRAAGGKEILAELPKEVDLSTPQKALESFAGAINRGDLRAMALCISGGRPHRPLGRIQWLADAIRHDAVQMRFALSQLKETKAEGDEGWATGMVETFATASDGKDLPLGVRLLEPVALGRTSGRWRIAPYGEGTRITREIVTFVNDMGSYVSEDYDPAADVGHYGPFRRLSPNQLMDAIECRTRMTVLAQQVLRSAETQHGVLAIADQSALRKVCGKYDPAILCRCPARDAAPASFHFNEKLANASLASIKEPDRTILLYEGLGDKPAFRHGGETMIAHADGTCWLVSRQALAAQKWAVK